MIPGWHRERHHAVNGDVLA